MPGKDSPLIYRKHLNMVIIGFPIRSQKQEEVKQDQGSMPLYKIPEREIKSHTCLLSCPLALLQAYFPSFSPFHSCSKAFKINFHSCSKTSLSFSFNHMPLSPFFSSEEGRIVIAAHLWR